MKKQIVIAFIFLVLGFAIALAVVSPAEKDKSPEDVIEDLGRAIELAEEKGEYKCCIEPACDMCYLGHWKFEKGTCYCDDAMAEGRDQDVCPQCVKGLEEGRCKSADEEFCEINNEQGGG